MNTWTKSLGLLVVGTAIAVAQTPAPSATLPDSLLAYKIEGISLKTGPADVHAILLARGFKQTNGSGKPISEAPGMDDSTRFYERNYSLRERRGELIRYEDKTSGSQGAAGGQQVRRHSRTIIYQHLFPIGTVSELQRSWTENPDNVWFKPLFEQVCANHERVTQQNQCAREKWRLMARPVLGVSITLTPSSTMVSLSQTSYVGT